MFPIGYSSLPSMQQWATAPVAVMDSSNQRVQPIAGTALRISVGSVPAVWPSHSPRGKTAVLNNG